MKAVQLIPQVLQTTGVGISYLEHYTNNSQIYRLGQWWKRSQLLNLLSFVGFLNYSHEWEVRE